MKKLNKKRITILIFLVIVVIFEIIAFRDSRANKMIEVTLATVDNSGFLDVEETKIHAINGEESGYYIFLPEYINEKKAVKYIVKQQTIKTQNKETNKENSIKENVVEENINNCKFTKTPNKYILFSTRHFDVIDPLRYSINQHITRKVNRCIFIIDCKVKISIAVQKRPDFAFHLQFFC